MSNEQTTGSDGKATFENTEYGDYTLTITADGYTTKTENIAFRSNHKNFSITLVEDTPTGTGTVTVTLLNTESEEAKGGIYLCDSNEEPYEDDSNVIAYGQTTNDTNPVTLTLYDVETHEATEVTDIPFDTYYVFAKDNGSEEFYTGTLTVDGDETVTITLTQD